MDDTLSPPVPDAQPDVLTPEAAAGRRLSLAMESLGEALAACEVLPSGFQRLAESLATGRSVVPADGEARDFVRDLRERLEAPLPVERAGDPARSLVSWLGRSASSWLAGALDVVPARVEMFGLRSAVELCRDARLDLLDLHRGAAEAHAAWYAAGLDPESARAFSTASSMALDEAIDRWVGLGSEGDLGRYVVTWQRSSSGWAERHLGSAVEVDVTDLGRLRALRVVLDELQRRGAPKRLVPSLLAHRLGVSTAEATRLLGVEAAVAARRDPKVTLGRRWHLVAPVAEAARTLGAARETPPTASEIAAVAGVHPALVELILEALGDA